MRFIASVKDGANELFVTGFSLVNLSFRDTFCIQ